MIAIRKEIRAVEDGGADPEDNVLKNAPHTAEDLAADDWSGRVGLVTELVPTMLRDPAETVAMVCGPEIMMRFTAQTLAAAGVPEHDIHVSMERNMKCGIGWCGHCQLGPHLICRDGPVFPYPAVRDLMTVWEL